MTEQCPALLAALEAWSRRYPRSGASREDFTAGWRARERHREGDAWQPIETAPRDGTQLLLCVDGEPLIGFWATSKAPYKFEGWTSGWETAGGYDVGFSSIGRPTHWMPLPEPPAVLAAIAKVGG